VKLSVIKYHWKNPPLIPGKTAIYFSNSVSQGWGLKEFVDIQKQFYEDLLESWVLMQPFIPFRYIQEMQGVADATGLSLEDIAVLNVGPYFVINCGSFAAWGPATHNGTMYHARSHDFPINIQDPETGAYLVEHQLLIVRKPDGFFKSVSPSLAGDVTCSDGINEMGIIPGMLSSWTADETYQGIGVGFRVRIALDCAATLEEAIHILTQNRTLGYNFIVSDGKIPDARGLATTPQKFDIIKPNQFHELLPHPMEDAVLISGRDRYEKLAERVRDNFGKINVEKALRLMDRPVAMKSNLHNVLFAPQTLEFWVAHAGSGTPACDEPYTHYSLSELLSRIE